MSEGESRLVGDESFGTQKSINKIIFKINGPSTKEEGPRVASSSGVLLLLEVGIYYDELEVGFSSTLRGADDPAVILGIRDDFPS